MNRVYCFGFSSPEGDAVLENRRAKVELYEQIRQEYEHGDGTIRAVARKLGGKPSASPPIPSRAHPTRASTTSSPSAPATSTCKPHSQSLTPSLAQRNHR